MARSRSILKWGVLSIGGIVLLLVLCLLALRFYFVQDFVVTQVSKYLSKTTNGYVEVEQVRFTILDDLLLKNVLVKDTKGDTLLHVGALKAGFNSTIFGLFKKRLAITDVEIENAQLNVRRTKEEELDNLQQFLKAFQKETTQDQDTTQTTRPFDLDVQRIQLKRVTYSRLDSLTGNYLHSFVEEGSLEMEAIDLANQLIVVDKVNLRQPAFYIKNFEYDSLQWVEVFQSVAQDSFIQTDTSQSFVFQVNDFELSEGQFKLDNERAINLIIVPDSSLNYNHLEAFEINLEVQNFYFINQTYSGRLECLSLLEKSGFQLNQLMASEVSVSPTQTALYGMRLQTPQTILGDTLVFQYEQYQDFAYFNDKVSMSINFDEEAQVRLGDIMVFAGALENNRFFRNNRNKQIRLSGQIDGAINDLEGEDLVLQLNGNTRLAGRFSSRNLTNPELAYVHSEFKELRTDIRTLKRLIPNFSLPNNFNKLGAITYSGNLDAIFGNLVIDGTLISRLGNATLDIQFNEINQGFERASYGGELALNNFDLGSWLDDTNFGKISMSAKVEEGKGLTGKTADATLSASVQSFEYKQYNYQNATFEGRLNQQLFQGNLNVFDEHVNLSFKGRLDYTKTIPNFDFNLSIQQLDLLPLNLYKNDLSVVGVLDIDIDLPDNELAKSEGTAFVKDINISNKNYSHKIDSLILLSTLNNAGGRRISVQSDLINGTLIGQYELSQLPKALGNYANAYFPNYARKFNISGSIDTISTNQAELDLTLFNTGDLTKIFLPKLDTLDDIILELSFDDTKDDFRFNVDIPSLTYDSITFHHVYTKMDFDQSEGGIDIGIDSINLKSGTTIEPIVFVGYTFEEMLEFSVNYAKQSDLEYRVNIAGAMTPFDSTFFEVVLDTTNLNLLGASWDLSPANSIVFGDSSVIVNNFEFNDQRDRIIRLQDYENEGLILDLEAFDLDYIDTLWNYPILDFGGKYNLTATAKNLFDLSDISIFLTSDSLYINEDDWGELQVKAFMENLNSSISTYLRLARNDNNLTAMGYYNPPAYQSKTSSAKVAVRKPNYFDIAIKSDRYPLRILEYFLVGASDFEGTFNANLALDGEPTKPNVKGYVAVENVAATIDFLNTRYFVEKDTAIVTNRWIEAKGTVIKDEMGNTAEIKRGGLTHNRLKNLGVDLEVTSKKFLAMNTTKKDNPVFYGRGIGSGDIIFKGPLTQTDIFVRSTAGKGTNITIPVANTAGDTEVSFIRFSNEEKEQKDSTTQVTSELTGVNLVLNLTLTDEAEVELIFDEQAGDILRGRGNGDLQINLNRLGEMSMYGNYFVQGGEYLFTLFNLVNKPFIVEQGGKIQWQGDPFNATIDIAAEYKDLNTSIANLIPEYLGFASADARNRASQPTSVDLTMYLKGELFEPSISFDLGFPRLETDLKTYVDNKLRTLRQDQNELNRQVFGLIVLGQFIPSEFSLSGQSGSDITINTVSELVANQLSILVTDFFDEVFDDSNIISSIDFDIAYNRYKNDVDFTQENFFIYGEEIGIRQKASLFNDRVTLIIGGNRTSAATSDANRTALGGDIVVEGFLNEERTLKLRAYSIFEPSIVEGNDTKVGAGLSYRKKYSSFKELFQSIFNRKEKEDTLK